MPNTYPQRMFPQMPWAPRMRVLPGEQAPDVMTTQPVRQMPDIASIVNQVLPQLGNVRGIFQNILQAMPGGERWAQFRDATQRFLDAMRQRNDVVRDIVDRITQGNRSGWDQWRAVAERLRERYPEIPETAWRRLRNPVVAWSTPLPPPRPTVDAPTSIEPVPPPPNIHQLQRGLAGVSPEEYGRRYQELVDYYLQFPEEQLAAQYEYVTGRPLKGPRAIMGRELIYSPEYGAHQLARHYLPMPTWGYTMPYPGVW